MKPSYHGNAKPYAMALYAAADQSGVMPVLQQLDAKGLNLYYRPDRSVKKGVVRRACVVIVFLSAQSLQDSRFEDTLLYAKAMDVPLVCVNLDRSPLHDSIKRLLFVSNIIYGDRYPNPEALVERIMTAESLENPTLTKAQKRAARRMALLIFAGVLIIVSVAGLLIWQRIDAADKAQVQTVQEEEPVKDVAGLLNSGLTEADLQEIHTLFIVGDTLVNASKLDFYRNRGDDVSQMDIDGKTVWSIDGREVPRGTAPDISLIGHMTNLKNLILINQSITDISPLASLENLKYIEMIDCPVDSLEPLADMQNLQEIWLEQTNVTSLTPLQNCRQMRSFYGDLAYCDSLDGLGLPEIYSITVTNASRITNLDPLSACGELQELTLSNMAQLEDISGLAGCSSLKELLIYDAPRLQGNSALAALTTLEQVEIYRSGITDLSWLKQSRGLRILSVEAAPVSDFSWTSGMEHLTFVGVHSSRLRDFNFLKELGVGTMELQFSGDIGDYSGLAAIPHYSCMHLNPRDGNLDLVLPYLQDASFTELELVDCNGIDFSALPQQVKKLRIAEGNLSNLNGLSALSNTSAIELESLGRLSSLDGLADCEPLTRVVIRGCIRLTDYEELYQKPYDGIELINLPVAPDLSRLQISEYGRLKLDSLPGITDISPLETNQLNIDQLELLNLDGVVDLSALKHMKVMNLVVGPQLEDQARQLRDDGYIDLYNIAYPSNELWAENIQNIPLLSLDELNTLPDALLSRVTELSVIGGCVIDSDAQNWAGEWDNAGQHFLIVDRKSGEMTPAGPGVIDQIGSLQKLTSLQTLRLFDQPLTSLQGIQALGNLTMLEIRNCPVTDAAAAFTLTQLEWLILSSAQITSIQGVQNLTNLTGIDLSNSKVEDISALKECNFDSATEKGGFYLQLGYVSCKDFSALACNSRVCGADY